MLNIHSVLLASPQFLSTDVDGQTVILQVETGQYFNLDRIGSEIWRLLSTPISVFELCDQLIRRYNAPLDVVQQDVLRLLESMQEKGLVLLVSKEEAG